MQRIYVLVVPVRINVPLPYLANPPLPLPAVRASLYVIVKVPTLSYATALAYQARLLNETDPTNLVIVRKYRYHVPVNVVDAIIAAGGVVTRTTNQVTSAILDKA